MRTRADAGGSIGPPARVHTCLEPLCEAGNELHPYAVDLLHALGRSRDFETQNLALECVRNVAWKDMSTDIRELEGWCARHAGQTIDGVVAASAQDWVARLERAKGKARDELIEDRRPGLIERSERSGARLKPVLEKAGLFDVVTDRRHRRPQRLLQRLRRRLLRSRRADRCALRRAARRGVVA